MQPVTPRVAESIGEKTGLSNRRTLGKISREDQGELHKALEGSPFMSSILQRTVTKEAYAQYLVNIRHDFQILERLISATYPGLQLNPLFRCAALDADIHSCGQTDLPTYKLASTHKAHYENLARELPDGLLAHFRVHYLALLYGGVFLKKALERIWDHQAPIKLYQFEGESKTLATHYEKVIDDYCATLTTSTFNRVVEEHKTAWFFAGDIIGYEIRQ